jgi:hypothetical protein
MTEFASRQQTTRRRIEKKKSFVGERNLKTRPANPESSRRPFGSVGEQTLTIFR